MKIAISGASGFVGTCLKQALQDDGHQIVPLRRKDFSGSNFMQNALSGAHAVIHLAGAPIVARWTESYKREIVASRIDTTRLLVDALRVMPSPPGLFISTSGVGIYQPNVPCDESATVFAEDFLGTLARDWEREALAAREFSIRTIIFRLGAVLGRGGGVLQKMLLPFRLGLGGIIGDGMQAFSWIHIHDLISAYRFVIAHEQLSGIFNLSAPHPATNAGFTQALGSVLHRPTVLPVPAFLLRLRFGEGADIVLKGQHALPRRLLECGFGFAFPTIHDALQDLCSNPAA
mgnify:CR=1 FL=1